MVTKRTGFKRYILLALVGGWMFGGDDDNKPSANAIGTASVAKLQPQTTVASQDRVQTTSLDAAMPSLQETSPPPSQKSFAAKTMFVDADRLNVRNGAGKSHKTIWTLKRDQAVKVVGEDGEWLNVKGERFSGWVFGTYLTPQPGQKKKTAPSKKNKPGISDAEIVKLLISRSLSLYSGNCPCPYNTTRRGRKCGRRSAYSRPGGASPLCYARDVSRAMINDYRSRL